MTFSTMTFILFFLPAIILMYYAVPVKWTAVKNGILLAASLIFYAWGEPVNVLLILLCVGVTFFLSPAVEQKKRWGLILAAAVNILPLLLFKYTDFFLDNLNQIPGVEIPLLSLALPAGISFYTFQVLTYIVDLYRGKVNRQKNPAYLALYVFFFPQLIAGPIVRYVDIEDQLENRTCTWEKSYDGFRRFVIGLAKKMLIANQAGMIADVIGSQRADSTGTVMLWVGVIAFGIQILYDFSGYSDMAIGIGKMFGFTFLENFDKPYQSTSVTDFWRRWHMSLSSFFRDYVYIPLGGSRVKKSRHLLNLFLVWFLTGLWHGASWNFALWGIYYFLLLSAEKFIYGKYLERLPMLIRKGITFVAFMFGWGLFSFESNSLGEIGNYVLQLLGFGHAGAGLNLRQMELGGNVLIMLAGLLLAVCPKPSCFQGLQIRNPILTTVCEGALILFLAVVSVLFIVSESFNPFIYFRF